ncbi:MAG: 2-oxoacid:acceptor oxidoreductase family protein [Pseudothermotoga sp.]
MKSFNIFLIGAGGQGIGPLSEVIAIAIDYSGQMVIGVGTHGLAQRGGVVSSHIKIGKSHSPLIGKHDADLILALEGHEAARAIADYTKVGSTVVYYNSSWQPLDVRLGKDREITEADLEIAGSLILRIFKVCENLEGCENAKHCSSQKVDENRLIPEVGTDHYILAMKNLMSEAVFEKNRSVFLERRSYPIVIDETRLSLWVCPEF